MQSLSQYFFCCRPKADLGQGGTTPSTRGSTPAQNKPRADDSSAPTSSMLKCQGRRCQRPAFCEIVGSVHVRAIGGGLVAYGLATWWVMGSGLIIAGVGAAIWSISTLAHANNASLYVRRWNYTKGANVSVSAVVFTEVGASVGWATPPGWVLLAAWDLYWLGDKLLDCCVGRRETLYESILSNEQGQSVSGNDGSASDERRVKLDHDQAGLAGDNGDDSE